MANLIFVHKRIESYIRKHGNWYREVQGKGGETVVMEQLETWFFNGLKEGDFFDKKIGKARCSSDDNFSKKDGREIAKNRMKTKKLTVDLVLDNLNQKEIRKIYLKDSEGMIYILVKYSDAKSVFFVDFYKQLDSIL